MSEALHERTRSDVNRVFTTKIGEFRDRLAERMPSYQDNIDDPTDPGWLLLEQAAWMVELLSEQLDQYPFAVVQHFIHMMGGHLLPAQPAIGSVVVEPAGNAEMKAERSRPRRWRFFTQQSETDDVVEFVPLEASVPLRRAVVLSSTELSGGELFTAGKPEGTEGIAGGIAWRGRLERSTRLPGLASVLHRACTLLGRACRLSCTRAAHGLQLCGAM